MRSSAPLLAVILGLQSIATGCGRDDGYPDRPIVLLCPWARGGGTDRVSRQIGAYLEKELGVAVNVINATGGEGVTGHRRGALARPDGHTLLMMTVEINMLHHRRLTNLTWEDYTPLMLLNRDAAALFVRSDALWKNVAELTEEIRQSPGKLTASGTATGGIWHLAAAGWLTSVGLSPTGIRWIPMGGAGPSLKDLAAEGETGSLDMVCCSLPEARAHLKAGRVRCLGVMSDAPTPGYEDVPTFRSQGIDWTMGGWRGLALPRGVPQEVLDALLPALERILRQETLIAGTSFLDFMNLEGYDATWERPDEFRKTLARTDDDLGKLLLSEEFAALSVQPLHPMTFPAVILFLLAVVLGAAFIRGFGTSGPSRTAPSAAVVVRFAEVILAVALYLALAETLGFVLTASPIILYLLWRLGTRLRVSVAITVVLVPLVFQLFEKLMRVNLPHGLFGW
ncbi:MAG: tripartite tricarboxylate transporter substrate-binding protein [Planctomycetota bacterium]|nr:tripartite tricarboxylate transporter substrate-binding protein [Planctomycetota bacterium]